MTLLRLVALALALAGAAAECPNACSGHGDCANYDMCLCYRNWQGSDCSERTCPFGLAHVDSPKGDLDSSADALSGPGSTIVEHSTVYPYGTQEQFPNMTTSRDTPMQNTAHYYMECSNKGICDRKTGECDCFDGYEGSSCQRASCPNDCSGHGTCEHIKTLAALDTENIYDLWDAELTMGCLCDPGYSGPDCSTKDCKFGIDPLYVDDEQTARVEAVNYRIYAGASAGAEATSGTYALKFYDVFGEDYVTDTLDVDASCTDVVSALSGLPNTVIADGSVVCTDVAAAASNTYYTEYSLTFTGNPGYLKQLFVDTYLDGDRPTVYGASTLDATVEVFNTGMTGEFVDYFATQCRHTYVTIESATGLNTVTELTSGFKLKPTSNMGTKLLKECLGDSDGVELDNVEVYDWDYGSLELSDNSYMMSSYPHAVKLVEVDPTDDFQGGMYYLTWWSPTAVSSTEGEFIIANMVSQNHQQAQRDATYAVYVTDGVVERVIIDSDLTPTNGDDDALGTVTHGDQGEGEIGLGANNDDPRITAYFTAYSNVLYTSYDTACETAYAAVEPCLDRGDMLFIVDSKYLKDMYDPLSASGGTYTTETTAANVVETGNLYTIKKIYKEDPTDITFNAHDASGHEDRFRIVLDKNLPFAGTTVADATNPSPLEDGAESAAGVGVVNLFKFSPATTGNYEFVSQCSNRGTCDEGVCECFKGYTNDNCDTQSSLAV